MGIFTLSLFVVNVLAAEHWKQGLVALPLACLVVILYSITQKMQINARSTLPAVQEVVIVVPPAALIAQIAKCF